MRKVKTNIKQRNLPTYITIQFLGWMLSVLILLTGCSSSNNLTSNYQTVVDELRLVYDEKSAVAKQIGTTVSNDGKRIAFAYDNGIVKVVDLITGRTAEMLNTTLADLFEIRFNYDGSKLILAEKKEVKIINITSGTVTNNFKLSKNLNRIAISKTDDYVAFGTTSGVVHIYDLNENKKIQELKPGARYVSGLDFDPKGKNIAVAVRSALYFKRPIKIFNVHSGKEVKKLKRGFYSGMSYTKDGNKLITMGMEGFSKKTAVNFIDIKNNDLESIFIKTNKISAAILTSGEIYRDLFLGSTMDHTFDVIDMNSGKKVYTTLREKTLLYAPKIGIDKKRIYPLYDGKSYLINYSDNNINQIYDAEANSISAYLYSDANDNFAVVARDGRMEGNSEAIANVAWSERKSSKRVPLEATFDQFYTPRLLQTILSGDGATQDITSLERAVEFTPLVNITRPDSIVTTDMKQLEISVTGISQGDEIKELKIFVNGKPIQGDQRGFKIAGSSNTQTFTVPLLPGRNTINAVAVSEGGYQSAPDQVIANYQGQIAEARLHILAVGIDEYRNTSYNLNYATADASTLTREIQQKAGDIFSEVSVTSIQNEEATKERIEQAVEAIQSTAQLQDVFMFYYAGHGVMSEGTQTIPSDFYLALHDVTQLYGNDEMLKDKGVSAAELRDIFSSIQAQKQLIVLDACQSGGAVETFAMRGAAEEKAMIQLARSSGVVLLASTGSEQFATEFAELGHGVFTYSILQGLAGGADSGDKKVTVKELEAFLNDSVPELTEKYKGMVQYPRSWSRGMDFPISIVSE